MRSSTGSFFILRRLYRVVVDIDITTGARTENQHDAHVYVDDEAPNWV